MITYPRIHNGQVVWGHYDGNDVEIFFWDGTSTRQLTDNAEDESARRSTTGRWSGRALSGYDADIFFWDGTSTRQLTDNDDFDESPRFTTGRWSGRAMTATTGRFFSGTASAPGS